MTSVEFFARGIPAPKGSLKHVGNGRLVEQVTRSGPWMSVVRATAIVAAHGWQHDGGPLSVTLRFVVPRPKTVRRPWPITRSSGDVDKLSRAVLDALTGSPRKGIAGIIRDDSAVVHLDASKAYDAVLPTGVSVTVREVLT